MTTTDEEIRALGLAEELLESLLHDSSTYYGRKWKRIPYALRVAARGILRHYPGPVKRGILYRGRLG